MCESAERSRLRSKTISVEMSVGTILAHDITEIRKGEFKGRAFRKGHVVREEDVCHLQRLGKERLFVLEIAPDEMHEDEAAYALAAALAGRGVVLRGEPKEGKIALVAEQDGLLKVNREALLAFNMLGDVMCATLHTNMPVRKGQEVAATRAIPLVVKRGLVQEAVRIAEEAGRIVEVREMGRPRVGVVVTGNEVYSGRIKDAFGPVIEKKIREVNGEIAAILYAPDDVSVIERRLRDLVAMGADLIITTGGMSVDPDDVTRFAIRSVGARDVVYGSSVLPGAMFLVAYLDREASGENPHPRPFTSIPILGIPACGMYHQTTVFDLILPRVLAGEKIGRRELAELGHGGLCMNCSPCRYPVCPFGK